MNFSRASAIALRVVFAAGVAYPCLARTQTRSLKGQLELDVVFDSSYRKPRNIYVYTPQSYSRNASYAYDFLLLFDADQELADSAVLFATDSLAGIGEIEPFVVVMMENGFRAERLADLGNDPRMPKFIGTQLIPWLRGNWNVTHDPHRVIIAGTSAGGLCAAYVALKHPDLIGNVISQSGAFWHGARGSNGPPFEWLTDQYKRSAKENIRFALSAGAMETERALGDVAPSILESNRHFRDSLLAKGYEVAYFEVPNGRHTTKDWNSRFPMDLLALTRAWGKR